MFQFCFELFNRRQAFPEAFGKSFGEMILRDSDRLAKVSKSVFCYDFVF